MKRIFAAAALAGTLAGMLGGCSVYRDATSSRLDPQASWRGIATTADRERLRNWRTAWDDALPQARTTNAATIDADAPLFDPDRALEDAMPPAGAYRCRFFKLGKAGLAPNSFAEKPWHSCEISAEGEARGIGKQDGMQRPHGLIYPDSKARGIFLGTLVLGDETAPLRYGVDGRRNMIGYVERIEEKRWRLVLPYPRFESLLDIIEIVPAD